MIKTISEDELWKLQRDTFSYFQHYQNSRNGLIADSTKNILPRASRAMRCARYLPYIRRGADRRRPHRQLVLCRQRLRRTASSRHHLAGKSRSAAACPSVRVWSTTNSVSRIKENDLGTTFGGGMLAMAAVAGDARSDRERRHDRERLTRRAASSRFACRASRESRAFRAKGCLLGHRVRRPGGPVHKSCSSKRSSPERRAIRMCCGCCRRCV